MSIVYRGKTLAGSYLPDLSPIREELHGKADLSLYNLDIEGNRKIIAGSHARVYEGDFISGEHSQYYYEILLDEHNNGWYEEDQLDNDNYEVINDAPVFCGIYWPTGGEDQVRFTYPKGHDWEENHEYTTWDYHVRFIKRSPDVQGTWGYGDLLHRTTENGELFQIAVLNPEAEHANYTTILELDHQLDSGEYDIQLERSEGVYTLRIHGTSVDYHAENSIEVNAPLHYQCFSYTADISYVDPEINADKELPGFNLNITNFWVQDECYITACSRVSYKRTPSGLKIVDSFWVPTVNEIYYRRGYGDIYVLYTEETDGHKGFRLPLGTLYGNIENRAANRDLTNLSDYAGYVISGYANALETDTIHSWQVRGELEGNFCGDGLDVYQNDTFCVHNGLLDEYEPRWRQYYYPNPTQELYPDNWMKVPVKADRSYCKFTFFMRLCLDNWGSYMGGSIISTGRDSDALGSVAIEQTPEHNIRVGVFTKSGFVTLNPVEDMPISDFYNSLYGMKLILRDNTWLFDMWGTDESNQDFHIHHEYTCEGDPRFKYDQIIFGMCNSSDWYEDYPHPELQVPTIKFEYGEDEVVRPYKAVYYQKTNKGQKVVPVDCYPLHMEGLEVEQELRDQNRSEYYKFYPMDGTDKVTIPQKAALISDNGKISPERETVDSALANKWGILDYKRYADVRFDHILAGSTIHMPNGNIFTISEDAHFDASGTRKLILWDCDNNCPISVNALDCYSAGQTVSDNKSIYYAFYATGYAGAEFTFYTPTEIPILGQIYELINGEMVPTSREVLDAGQGFINFNAGYYEDLDHDIILDAHRDASRDVEFGSDEPYYYYRLSWVNDEEWHKVRGSVIHKYALGSDEPIDTNGYSMPFAYIDSIGKLHINNLIGFFGGAIYTTQGVQVSVPRGLKDQKPFFLKGTLDFSDNYSTKSYNCQNEIILFNASSDPFTAGLNGRALIGHLDGARSYRISTTPPPVDDGFYNGTIWYNPELNHVQGYWEQEWHDLNTIPLARILEANDQGQISHMQVLLPRDASDLSTSAQGLIPSFFTQLFAENEEGKWMAPANGWWTVEVEAGDSTESGYMHLDFFMDDYVGDWEVPSMKIRYSSNDFRDHMHFSNSIFTSHGRTWSLGYNVPEGSTVKVFFTFAQEGDI